MYYTVMIKLGYDEPSEVQDTFTRQDQAQALARALEHDYPDAEVWIESMNEAQSIAYHEGN